MKPKSRRITVVSLLSISLSILAAPAVRAADLKPSRKGKNAKKKSVQRGFRVGPKHKTHYVVDPDSDKNQITFTSKAPRETTTGTTTTVKGHLNLKPRKLAKAKGQFSVAWKSIDTGNGMRNQHMLSAPWADTKKYPDIVFTLKGIEKVKRKGKSGKSLKAKLIGTFAMNGEEKDFKIPATLVYLKPDKSDKGDKITEGIGIRCKFTVALKDFNIKGRGIGQGFAAKEQVQVSLFLKRVKTKGTKQVKIKDAQYTIISSNTIPEKKRYLQVRLSKKISETALRDLALKLKSLDPNDYERTFIGYLLPYMEPDAGAWATANFDPDLKVEVLGLTLEEEKRLVSILKKRNANRKVIGQWVDDTMFQFSHVVTIYRKDGKLYLEQQFESGGPRLIELIKTKSGNGWRDKEGNPAFSDYWVIDANGNLQVRDKDGLINTARAVD